MENPNFCDAIRRRAQELYEQRGRVPGHEVEDWLQAEAEINAQIEHSLCPAYISVKVADVTYIAEYDRRHCGDYRPGEFQAGDPVRVRLESGKLFITRPNGMELEARIVRAN